MSDFTLLKIADSFAYLERLLDESEEREEGIDKQTADYLASIIQTLPDKVDNIIDYNDYVDSHISTLEMKIEQLKEAVGIINRRKYRFNQYLIDCMDILKVEKINGSIGQISIRKPQKIIEITDPDKIPFEYLKTKTTVEIAKSEIKDALKSGAEIEGARLIDGKRTVNFKAVAIKK